MEKKVSIIIPMQQHSYQTATGLIKAGLLDRYYTTVYYRKTLIYSLLKIILPSSLRERMEGRCLPVLTPFVKTEGELIGLSLLFASRVPLLKRRTPIIRKILFRIFSKKTAYDCIRRSTPIVWGFDSWSVESFKELNKSTFKTIKLLDMASTAATTIQQIINEEYDKKEAFYYTYERNRIMYSDVRVANYVEEFTLADYFLSPSDWVTKSLVNAGVDKDKILYLPHGVDVGHFKIKNYNKNVKEKLRFLFVGRVEAAKGIRYLFDAFSQLQDYPVELLVVGNSFSWTDEVKAFSPNIQYLGLKKGDEMPDVYQEADVFILSSLWEGSALSMLEAMSSGLPVIASSHSCAPDIIIDGEQGFVYNPYDIESLKKHIVWYVNHQEYIESMGRKARKTAEQNSWEQYYENVADIVEQVINKKG